MRYLYHGTLERDYLRIIDHGSLDPKAECERTWFPGNWSPRYDCEAIYVTKRPEMALHWAGLRQVNAMEDRKYELAEPIVLRIDVHRLPKSCKMKKDPNAVDAWMLKGCRIPTDIIEAASLNLRKPPSEWLWGV